MKEIPAEMIWQHFSSLADLRMQYRAKHKLADIIGDYDMCCDSDRR